VFQTRLNGRPQFFIVLGGKTGLNLKVHRNLLSKKNIQNRVFVISLTDKEIAISYDSLTKISLAIIIGTLMYFFSM